MNNAFKLVVLLLGCAAAVSAVSSACVADSLPLFAGQTIPVGSVSLINTDSHVQAKIVTSDGWMLSEVHVYVGTSAPNTVAPGQFAFSQTLSNPTNNFLALVPLPSGSACDDMLAVAVHVVVSKQGQTETAWAQGSHAFTGARWGWWANFQARCGCAGVSLGTNSTNAGNVSQCCACPSTSESQQFSMPSCAPFVTKVFGGQTLHALDLLMTNTRHSFTMAVSNQPTWSFGVIHLYIGTGPIPSTRTGTPIPGQFPFQIAFPSNIESWSNTWSLDELAAAFGNFVPSCGQSFYVLAHFELHGPSDETGWGFGEIPFSEFGSNRWGWAMNYTWCCYQPPVEENEGCTFTQGYWKNHNDFSSRPSQKIAWPIDEETVLCNKSWLSILKTPVKGDKRLILAHQWIAASLNVANGADPSAIATALIDAESLLKSNCESLSRADSQIATRLAGLLDNYNNGIIGPGHCDDAVITTDVCSCRCPVPDSNSTSALPPFEVDSANPTQVSRIVVQKANATKLSFALKAEEGSAKARLIVTNAKTKSQIVSDSESICIENPAKGNVYRVAVQCLDATMVSVGSVSIAYEMPESSVSSNGGSTLNGGDSTAPSTSNVPGRNGEVASGAAAITASALLSLLCFAVAIM